MRRHALPWFCAKVAEFGAVKRVAVLSNKHCDTSQELPEAAGYYELRVNALRAFARVVDLKNRRRGLSSSPYSSSETHCRYPYL